MTAPTNRDGHDDDLTVPVSELLAQHGNPFRDIPKQAEPETAPLTLDVSIAIFMSATFGVVAGTVAQHAPNSEPLVWCVLVTFLLIVLRWTRKR